MTVQDKQLLLKDLCARLPYGVKVKVTQVPIGLSKHETLTFNRMYCLDEPDEYITVKPYLRPMSSMTEEEKKEYNKTCIAKFRKAGPGYTYDGWWEYYDTIVSFDYLNANHFDYRGLIEKGLAIEVTEENNPYEN